MGVPDMTIRLGLGGILMITGINLLDKNKSRPTWVFGTLLGVLIVSVATYTVVAMRGPRTTAEPS